MAQQLVQCELCDEDIEGCWFCKNCHQSLCDKCKRGHQRSNVSKHHDIISRDDMSRTQGDAARPVDEYCKSHRQELYLLFCRRCCTLICRFCLTGEHSRHDVIPIERIFNEKRKELETFLQRFTKERKDGMGYISKQQESLETKIKEEASRVKREVDAVTNILLDEISAYFTKHRQGLSNQEEGVVRINKGLQGNKTSEILKAVEFCSTLDEQDGSGVSGRPDLSFVPGKKGENVIRGLLGTLELDGVGEELCAYIAFYASLNDDTMCLSYKFPPSLRVKYSEPVAQLIGTKSFSTNLSRFSIEIKEEGESRFISIGMVRRDFEKFRLPGWDKHSYGYHADDGNIFAGMSSSADASAPECYRGDVMECRYDVISGRLAFLRNGEQVYAKIVSTKYDYYPIVALESPGEVVHLREREPWFSK